MNDDTSQKPKLKKISQKELNKMLVEYEQWVVSEQTGGTFHFRNYDLSNKTINNNKLYKVDFSGSDLSHVTFSVQHFAHVNFSNSTLESTKFNKTFFQGCNFTKASLENVNLENSRFQKACLDGAVLTKGKLAGTTFRNSSFVNSILSEANLTNSDLNTLTPENVAAETLYGKDPNSNFEKANFQNATLKNANLQKANLANCDFSYSDLSDAKLQNSILTDAIFSGATLIKTYFSGAELKKAKFINANLTNAFFDFSTLGNKSTNTDLTESDFSGAMLTDANLIGSNLTDANFQNATLVRADLREAKTFGMNLGGANVTNANLPAEIKGFESLKTIEENSKIARKMYAWLLGVLAFSILSIFSTKDPALLTNSATSPLPVIQTPIPMGWFHLIAPFFIFGLYLYFHLQLQHQWRLISKLPAVFPDGTLLHEKLYPWLLNTWVRNFFPHLKKTLNAFSLIRVGLVVTLAWYATPIIMLGFWARYLAVHDFIGNRVLIILALLTFIAAIFFHYLAKATLQNRDLPQMKASIISAALVIPFCIFASHMSAQSVRGDLVALDVPLIFKEVLQADFRDRDVSLKPDNWDPEKPTRGIRGAKLFEANLRYMVGENAFLAKADMRHADLLEADLVGADLQEAQLQVANMTGVNLRGANLKDAKLTVADITYAIFIDAKGLTAEQIREADNWNKAIFSDPLRTELGFTYEDMRSLALEILHFPNPHLKLEDFAPMVDDWLRRHGMEEPSQINPPTQ